MRKVKTAIITAAGFGTRFLPIVKNVPKEMLPIINKPILQYLVEECLEADIEKIIIVIREGNDTIYDYFKHDAPEVKELLDSVGKSDRYNVVDDLLKHKDSIQVVPQIKGLPYGNGSPIVSAKHLLDEGEPFCVLFGDDIVITPNKSAIGQLVDFYQQSDCDAVMGTQEVELADVVKYGVVKPKQGSTADSGEIEYIIEKPTIEEAPSQIVGYGRFVVPYRIFDYLKTENIGKDDELWLQDANSKIAETGKFVYKVIDGTWYTTGDPFRYFEALVMTYLQDPEYRKFALDFLAKVINDNQK